MHDTAKNNVPAQSTDEVLHEVWRIKDELSAQYGHDLDKFFDGLIERQKESERAGFRVVDLSVKPSA